MYKQGTWWWFYCDRTITQIYLNRLGIQIYYPVIFFNLLSIVLNSCLVISGPNKAAKASFAIQFLGFGFGLTWDWFSNPFRKYNNE